MQVRFTKMHGLGNDFVVIDLVTQHLHLQEKHIRLIADRHRGIGCDQVLLVEPPHQADTDFRYRIFNADGSEVGQCGNGARCFARFVRDKRLTGKRSISVETRSGKLTLKITKDDQVRVNMGSPSFIPEQIPFNTPRQQKKYRMDIAGHSIEFGALSIGNPHVVIRVQDVEKAKVAKIGAALESHPSFPERVNVGFIQIIDRNTAKLRVFERGAGETEACGSGACAAMAYAHSQGWLDQKAEIRLRGGALLIEWQGEGKPIYMTGPATRVFDGKIYL